jgi:hypothetical protein
LLVLPMVAVACGDDSDEPSSSSGGEAGGKSTEDKATGGKDSGTGGKEDTGDTGGKSSGTAGETGTGGTTGEGGSGEAGSGEMPTECDLSDDGVADLDRVEIVGPIDEDTTLTSGTVWQLNDKVHVTDGNTLTIEPCTRIEGQQDPIGVLIIDRGAEIDAVGTADEPILFTSQIEEGNRRPGDWGGVILLGQATNFNGADVLIEGLEDDPENMHGGSDDSDSSGRMSYVRIEYGGYELAPDVEINGLTFGSVGSGTTIDHIEVNTTLDDCFEWFGGKVDASYLVCNNEGDDMFDVDLGYRGELSYLFGRQVNPISGDPNGFEMDSSIDGKAPVTNITASNATLCGLGEAGANVAYGMVLRESLTGTLDNIAATGFDYGVDLRDPDTNISIANSLLFDMVSNDIGEPDEADDGEPEDEEPWFTDGTNNSTDSPGYDAGDCGAANGPNSSVTGSGVGAFVDDADWMQGAWISWDIE